MSNPDSFINEVTEEVRRDRLYGLLRKWGWVGVVAVLAIVGGAAFVEWRAARELQAAQATGDAILAATEAASGQERIAALGAVEAEGDAGAVVALLQAAEMQDPAEADATLAAISESADYPALYRDLADMKRVLIADSPLSPEEKIALLEPLAVAGGPFRVLAEEQIALAELAAGGTGAARERLSALVNDSESSTSLRQRAEELIIALGGSTE